MTRPISQRRLLSSRANGAISRGPRTATGKLAASQNALRHGLLARCSVLPNESHANFDHLLDQYIARLAPSDEVELGMIEEMVSATWRLRRLWAIENRSLADALSPDAATDELGRITAAFRSLATTPELNLMHRYETRLHRIHQRALNNLLTLKELPPMQILPNEPSPTSEQ